VKKQNRQRGGKADLDLKLQTSNTSRNVVGANSSDGF